MDWIERMQAAMDYVEENLREEIDWAELGRRALCPGAMFARMFSMVVDIPLAEYVRRRRLSCAAADLQRGDRVIDVALRYGYASPTAFTRAFTLLHGVTPKQARLPGVALQAYPPLSFHISITGGTQMEYRIEQKGALRMVGFAEEVSMLDGKNLERIPQIWREATNETWTMLSGYADGSYPGCFGVIDWVDVPADTLRYWIAVTSAATDGAKDSLQALEVAPATYAVFSTPMSMIQQTTRRIFSEWMPASGYEHAQMPEFEYYPQGDMSDPDKYIVEIWIPIVEK